MKKKIPKIIHYCWFGKNPLPDLALKCIESWKRHLPDYEIMEWNEDNFDINSNQYVKQAYESGKWAFVTDYVRLYALYNYGGIYMDTDVEVLRPLDSFLNHNAFSGFESNTTIPTGIIGSTKYNEWIKILLDDYNSRSFIKRDSSFDLTTNVETITKITKSKYNLQENNMYQVLSDDIHLYPSEWFCPFNITTGKLEITPNTHTIHHFSGSWLSKRQKIKRRIIYLLGKKITNKFIKIKRKLRVRT
ncbi:glycosyltransferase family 32 protein [Bacillus sp. E214]|uniref:glycosyltransferase family 32 protein n=1 Tax=Bacillus sp. E214 TaxID=2587156 RepID=UPI0011DF304E|nr:glycosyltransferase [Bacillus sp. E214]